MNILFLIQIATLAGVRALLVSMPEPVELLLFGVGLIGTVVVLRWFLNRGTMDKAEEKFGEKGLTNN